MGLNFKNSTAQWSYSGFNYFRKRLAKEIGINLYDMEGFGDGCHSWENVKDDIVPLLNHSDCEGELSPEDCKSVAPRLRELVSNWDNRIWEYEHDTQNARILADDMEKFGEKGIPLEFC